MPASNTRALEKSLSLQADAFIFDLEDAVSPDMKVLARNQAMNMTNSNKPKFGYRQVVIRVNATNTQWFHEDIEMAVASKCDAILLPKAEDASAIKMIAEYIDKSGGNQSLWLMIETPRGVLNADSLAGSSHRVSCLVAGTVDLANDLRCEPLRESMMHSLQHIVLAARANKISVLDGVFVDTSDEQGFLNECNEGRRLGFDGKTLIHPKTILATNKVFSPSEAELEKARRIIAAYAEAVDEGRGVATVDGKLVEILHVRGAERLLAFSQMINKQFEL